MEYDKFKEVTKRTEDIQRKNINKSILVQLSKVTRIQLSDVYNWELYNKLTSYLRTQLLSSPNNNQIQLIKNKNNIINICIYIRKGDVYTRPIHKSVKYYKNLKNLEFKKHMFILSEKWRRCY